MEERKQEFKMLTLQHVLALILVLTVLLVLPVGFKIKLMLSVPILLIVALATLKKMRAPEKEEKKEAGPVESIISEDKIDKGGAPLSMEEKKRILYEILDLIDRKNTIKIDEIAYKLDISQASILSIMTQLEDYGAVRIHYPAQGSPVVEKGDVPINKKEFYSEPSDDKKTGKEKKVMSEIEEYMMKIHAERYRKNREEKKEETGE